MAHFVDTGRPGEEPLTGKALTDFQATCEEKGEPPSPPEWEGLTIEEVATRRAARVAQGGVNGRESKVRYTELDVASGLHLPNRRLSSEQHDPHEPICAHTGLCTSCRLLCSYSIPQQEHTEGTSEVDIKRGGSVRDYYDAAALGELPTRLSHSHTY